MKTAKVFYGEDKVKSTLSGFKRHFDNMSISCIGDYLGSLSDETKISAFRIKIVAAGMALSEKGIAPRWQMLHEYCNTKDHHKALKTDAPLIDLHWLSITFPNHKTSNGRWINIFTNGFDIDLASSIAERQMTTAKKVRSELNLSNHQQLGCIRFHRQGRDSARAMLKRATERSKTAYKKEIRRAATVPQITEETAQYRALIWKSWILAEGSPTKAAQIYGWMTGLKMDKGSIRRTVNRMQEPVKRAAPM